MAVKIIAFNDFPRQPARSAARARARRRCVHGVPHGAGRGIEQFAAKAALRSGAKHSILVSATATWWGSHAAPSWAFFRDEPTIEAMNLCGRGMNAVGNHESGITGWNALKRPEKRRMRGQERETRLRGPWTACAYAGARFDFLCGKCYRAGHRKALVFAVHHSRIRRREGGLLGWCSRVHRRLFARGTKGASFEDEVETVNRLLPELRAQGVSSVVVVMHEGIGVRPGGLSDCNLPDADVRTTLGQLAIRGKVVADGFDPMVQLVITGHTHRYYVCESNGRLVTSAGSNGIALTEIDLNFDRKSGRVISSKAVNHRVDPAGPKDPVLTPLFDAYVAMAEPLELRVVARLFRRIAAHRQCCRRVGAGNMGRCPPGRIGLTGQGRRGDRVQQPTESARGVDPAKRWRHPLRDLFKAQTVPERSGADEPDRRANQGCAGATIQRRRHSEHVRWAHLHMGQRAARTDKKILTETIKLTGSLVQPDLQYRVVANAFLLRAARHEYHLRWARTGRWSVLDLEALVSYLQARNSMVPPLSGASSG